MGKRPGPPPRPDATVTPLVDREDKPFWKKVVYTGLVLSFVLYGVLIVAMMYSGSEVASLLGEMMTWTLVVGGGIFSLLAILNVIWSN